MRQKLFPIFILLLALVSAAAFLLFCKEQQALAVSNDTQDLSSVLFHTDAFENNKAYGSMVCAIPYDNALGQACEKDSTAELKILNESLLPKEERCYRLKLTDEEGEKNPLSLANLEAESSWELHVADGCEHLSSLPDPYAEILFYLDGQLMGYYVLISESSQ